MVGRLVARWLARLHPNDRRIFPIVALAALLPACRRDASADLPHQAISGFPVVQAGPDCAPWDGPAVTITFSGESPDPDSIRPPYLHVSLWKRLPSLVGRTWRWPGDEQSGVASLCLDEQDCRVASAGVVRLEPVGPDSVIAGRLRLEFADRPGVAGSFRAVWRSRVIPCG